MFGNYLNNINKKIELNEKVTFEIKKIKLN